MSFEGVLFDLDGVITNTAEYHYQSWQQLAKLKGIKIDSALKEAIKGISRKEALLKILHHGGVVASANEQNRLLELKNKIYLEIIQNLSSKDVFQGIEDLLNELKNNDKKIALASSSKNGPLILEKLGLKNFFDGIANPAPLRSKPAPDIFLEAARLIGIDPKKCIAIEDSRAGIMAIKSINALPIGISKDKSLNCDVQVILSSELNLQFLNAAWAKHKGL